MREKVVTIFGTAKAQPGDLAYEQANRLGKTLAEAGLTIANGGYGGTGGSYTQWFDLMTGSPAYFYRIEGEDGE